MSRFDDLVSAVMDRSRIVIVVMLLVTVAIGSGATAVEQSSSLDQFQSDSPEQEKLDYIDENFSTGEENTTTAQIIVEGDNVLSRASLIELLEYQQRLRGDEQINRTLVENGSTVSVANLVATTAIVREEGRELRRLATRLEQRREALEENRTALEARSRELNATAEDLRAALTALRRNPDASVRQQFQQVDENSSVELDEEDYATFREATRRLRNATSEQEAEQAYRLGTRGVLSEEYETLQQRSEELRAEGEQLRALANETREQQQVFENATDASQAEQLEQLRSMNDSEIESTVDLVLNGSNDRALGLMPQSYDPGSTSAGATVVLVTQTTESTSQAAGAANEDIVDAQLAMQDVEPGNGLETAVFGAGIITDEIDRSMSDSLGIVSPLALLFVLLALIIAYRDLLDIVLGLFGIGAVLVWTFGLMGWTGINFNQIFVAVPVLLIGLSIDYAIHIFMRHREERTQLAENGADDDGPRPSMLVALGGVGIALVWVTATTVIGFLSNLISPVPPIREFGLVSAAGIVATLLIFGLLVPSLKVELDELLEGFGIDRQKRAFGTGGGAFSSLLSVGSTAARKAPFVVILLTLLLSAGGAYGGSQVDTSFSQTDFIADDPPDYMDELPAFMEPGEYTAKQNLERINDQFIREDSQAQILIESDGGDGVAADDALERVDEAEAAAAGKGVTQELANGEADITSPLTVMRDVAADNESFNETFHAADTNGDGVPDENVTAVYDALYEVAPDRAESVIYREDGEYRALRIVVAIEGGASGDAVTDQMRDVAETVDGSGLAATATGSSILNDIVQDQLFQTVLESLVLSLVAVVVFLALSYRIFEGSASLGLVTMLPVVLSVAWILGTMFAVGVPFNVLTGMITSLTIGLGVAYCIHISERYNQELERTGDVWDAMDRAVTGTGGALLGSAATTVAGFGVLVFAILPPLQQFGFITGLTIIYAFLASVLVLPSLLVVWTRYAGPPEPREQLAERGLTALGRDGEAGESFDDSGFVSAEERAADANGASPVVEDQHGAAESARRSVSFDHVHPGGTVEVTVELAGLSGRLLLSEAFDGAVAAVDSVEPEPDQMVVRGGSIYVAWDHEGDARLVYEGAVPESVSTEDELLFTGQVLTANHSAPVSGVQRLTVVSDLFERIIARGAVTQDDLEAAARQLDEGDLTREQFERVCQAWLRGEDGLDSPALPPSAIPDPDPERRPPAEED